MVDYKYKDLFWKPYTDRQITIATEDGSVVLNNSDIHLESLGISESLCSEEQIRFGACEASSVKFKISNVFTKLTGKWITITEVIDGHTDEPFQIGRYKVVSDIPTADKEHRDVTAYDSMYDILHTDMTKWYNSILPQKDSTITLKQFHESFTSYFGLEEELPENGLVNDEMTVERTIDPEQISGRDVITAICEINGCFGHISRTGKFRYIVLEPEIQGLYPRNDLYPRDDLYPLDPKTENIGNGIYISCRYEDYLVESINKIQIRREENDIGAIYPNVEPSDKDNCYIVENNFLVYGKSAKDLNDIARRLLRVITKIIYRPAEITAVGSPCLEVGDAIRLNTKHEAIETYILSREMSGIQDLRDSYSASGKEKYGEKINSINTSILQLKGKANTLTRTVEETRLEMKDLGEGLSTEISVTAGQIRAELANTKENLHNEITITAKGLDAKITDLDNELSTEISVTASGLRGEITDTKNGLQTQITANASGLSAEITRAQGAEGNLSTRITATSDGLSAEITRATQKEGELSNSIKVTADGLSAEITRATKEEGNLSNRIKITADGLSAEITRAQGTEGNLSTRITANANGLSAEIKRAKDSEGTLSTQITATAEGIKTKVSKGEISSEISQEAGKISIKSNRFSLESTNCTITETGKITAKDVELSGKITATSGYIGSATNGFIITERSIYSGKDSFDSTKDGLYIGTDGISCGKAAHFWYHNGISWWTILKPSFQVSSNGDVYLGTGSIAIGSGGTSVVLISKDDISLLKTATSQYGIGTTIGQNNMILRKSNSEYLQLTNSGIAGNSIALGSNASKISFFGTTPAVKQTVSTISSTSSATTSTVATKINEVINALKKYGLL